MALAELVYSATEHLPPEEKYRVVAQMRDASFSVVSNISEGAARDSGREFARFLDIAAGSAGEIMGQSETVIALGLGPPEPFQKALDQAERTKRMLYALMSRVRRSL